MKHKALQARLADGPPLLLDAAMGSDLDRRGVRTTLPLWSAIGLVERPELVRQIHLENLLAGADILTTNTFRTTARTLRAAGLDPARAPELDAIAVRLANEARDEAGRHDVLIAGFDFLMVETMPTAAEAAIALQAARETGLPVTVGFVCAPSRPGDVVRLLSSESLAEAVTAVEPFGPSAVVANCAGPAIIAAALGELRGLTSLPTGGYANAGIVDDEVGWKPDDSVSPEGYAELVRAWIPLGARIVGGCCGTHPAHTAAMRRMIDGYVV
jgi:S-methylmethionine-dependent homocysteine/selenocysteine methylase